MTLESRLAEALDDGNHGGLAALQSELIDTADREVILDRLSRHRSPVVRAWTSGVARDLADERYVPMLRRLARDRDIDVRNVALQDLRTRWPAELPALLPHIRRELDGANAVQAMWLIASLRDLAARERLEALAADDRRMPYQRSLAGIVLLMLDEDLDRILSRIAAHDHDSMHWLVQAAVELDPQASAATLTDFVHRAPDASCRHYGESALARVSQRVTFADAD